MRPLQAVLLVVAVGAASATASGQSVDGSSVDDEEHPWLGINISREGYLGVLISDVIEDTPAEACGLLPNDEILEIGGERIVDGDELIATVSRHAVGDRVPLTYLRGGQTFTTVATLTARVDDRNEVFHRRLVGRSAPTITATWIDGAPANARHTLTNDDLRGDVVLMMVWSTSCAECRGLAAELAEFTADHADGVRALALSDESQDALTATQHHALGRAAQSRGGRCGQWWPAYDRRGVRALQPHARRVCELATRG